MNANFYLNAKLTTMPWHGQDDQELRTKMENLIYCLVLRMEPQFNSILEKDFAKKFEILLYKTSKSFKEYEDATTIVERVSNLLEAVKYINDANLLLSLRQQKVN
jgi:hypothetical protein